VLARHVGSHFIDGAAGHQPAMRDHGHAIGQRLGLLDVVRGEHDRATLVDQVAQHLPQRFARLQIEAHRRLIEEQQLRPAGNRHGELRLALLAAGQLAVGTVGDLLDTKPLDHGLHVVRARVIAGDLGDELTRPHDAGKIVLLHHDADAPARLDGVGILAEQFGRALVGILQAEQQGNGGRLAGTVRTEQGQHLAAIHRETEPVQGRDFAEALVRTAQLGQGLLRLEVFHGAQHGEVGPRLPVAPISRRP